MSVEMNEDGSFNIPESVPYSERLKEATAGQETMTREEIRADLESRKDEDGQKVFESVFDPETAVAPDHHWVKRGLVMSCEGANHPNHRHFIVRRG